MCIRKLFHELPGTKSSRIRLCGLMSGYLFITRVRGKSETPYTVRYLCKVVGPEAVELTKDDGTIYQTTVTSCTCESRLACVHMASLQKLVAEGEIVEDDGTIDALAEYHEEKDAYYSRVAA